MTPRSARSHYPACRRAGSEESMSQDTKALATRSASGGNGKWSGAVCVVTGAGSGIGRALSLELARRGAVVHANDVNGASASRVAAEIGGASRGVALDVRD